MQRWGRACDIISASFLPLSLGAVHPCGRGLISGIMAERGVSPVSALFPGVVESGGPRGRGRRSVDMEELAVTLPGGPWKRRGVQRLLIRVISYIQFLQHRIQETQSRLIPYSGRHGFLPLWTPRRSVDVACKRRNGRPGAGRRWRPKGSAVKSKLKLKRLLRQTLVPYVSSSSSDNGDRSPWLVPVSMSPASPHSPCSPPSSSAAHLELSPLLRCLPADDLPQALFEEVTIGSSEDVQDSALASSFSLDHSYQSYGRSSNNFPLEPTKESNGKAKCTNDFQQPPQDVASECGFRKCIQVYGAKSRSRRLQAYSSSSNQENAASSGHSAGTTLTQRPRTFSRLQQLRKKCVNGFIMFCRLNRRPYLSAHPGKASTTATKDLAELWRVMSARERRPYCMKALQFSLLHDRLVKSGSSGLPHESASPPKPVSVLLAEKAARSQELVDP